MSKLWRLTAGNHLRRSATSPWRRLSAAEHHRTIQAIPRERTGPHVAAKERDAGRIPAVVLSPAVNDAGTNKQLLTTDAKQIRELLKDSPFFCSTPIRLQVRAGNRSSVVLNSGTVLPVKVHRDAETGKVLNLVMAWAEPGSEMKVDVPVVFKGVDECPGLKKGGYLHKIRSSLKFLCPAELIPPKIEIDLKNLDIDDKVCMHDIQVHPSLKLLSKNETMPVCKILATKPDGTESK